METPLENKYLKIEMHSKGLEIFPTLQSALAISKGANCRLSLSFPKGYFIDIYPDSTITDLQRIEALENSNYILREKLLEFEAKPTSAD